MANCKPTLALTSPSLASRDDLAARFAGHELQWITVDMTSGAADAIDLPRPRADDIAFLQYTSGSTGAQGRDGQPRQPAEQRAADRPGGRPLAALDRRELAAALPRPRAHRLHPRAGLRRHADDADVAADVPQAAAAVAARDLAHARDRERPPRRTSRTTCAPAP